MPRERIVAIQSVLPDAKEEKEDEPVGRGECQDTGAAGIPVGL